MIIFSATEAQKKATIKYRKKTYKNWQVDLKHEDWGKIESKRQELGLSRAELLKLILKQN